MTTVPHDGSADDPTPPRTDPTVPATSGAGADPLASQAARPLADDELAEHSVWDEPGLSRELAGAPPPGSVTYASWLQQKLGHVDPTQAWLVTLGVAAAAGPLAVVGTFMTSLSSTSSLTLGFLTAVVLAPVVEELMKVAIALWVIEKRPYLFRSWFQIAICALVGGFVFAAVENVLYLNVYIADVTPMIVLWRWTVCVALHMGCSLVAGLGLIRIWTATLSNFTRPQLSRGAPLLMIAMLIHGLYNALAILIESLDFQF